ncbi:hypothetical protein FB451DRAFT_1228028 [Mycena latifolia]|nr:hypothetical protein FB451DRAFT_1228028 [Mycena latifolia]
MGTFQSCHECLFNLDILNEVLHHVARVDASGLLAIGAGQSLLSISLTATQFSGSAVRLIWRRLPGILPLLQLLPGFKLDNTRQAYHLGRSLDPEDWLSFEEHSVYVKEIVHISNLLLDGGTWSQLRARKWPLLPNLSRFRCSPWISADWQQLFLNSQIINLSPSLSTSPLCFSAAPPLRLTHLVLESVHPLQLCFPAELRNSLTSLELWHFHGFDPADSAWTSGFLPRLYSLIIICRPFCTTLGQLPPLLELRHLNLSYAMFTSVLHSLQSLSSQHLESISICGAIAEPEARRSICELVAQRWAGTLRHFEFNPEELQDIGSLRACTRLESVRLTECQTFPLSAVLGIAAGWNSLQSLAVPQASGIDLEALAHIARLFPHLVFLEIDLGGLTLLPPLSQTPTLSHGLKRLVLHSFSPLCTGDACLLARHLHRLFPRLDSIRYGGQIGAAFMFYSNCLYGFEPRFNVWGEVLEEVFRWQDSSLPFRMPAGVSPN